MEDLSNYVFLTTTVDSEDKIYAQKEDVEEACKNCSDCNGEDIEAGYGCLTAYLEICYQDKPIFYGSDLKERAK